MTSHPDFAPLAASSKYRREGVDPSARRARVPPEGACVTTTRKREWAPTGEAPTPRGRAIIGRVSNYCAGAQGVTSARRQDLRRQRPRRFGRPLPAAGCICPHGTGERRAAVSCPPSPACRAPPPSTRDARVERLPRPAPAASPRVPSGERSAGWLTSLAASAGVISAGWDWCQSRSKSAPLASVARRPAVVSVTAAFCGTSRRRAERNAPAVRGSCSSVG